MRIAIGLFLLAACLSSCGGDAATSGEPLVAGTLQASYDGTTFIPINGYATLYEGQPLIVLGAGPIHCGSEQANSPPRGYNAAIEVPDFVVAAYSNVFIHMYRNVGGFEGIGSNSGTLNISAVTADTISGDVSYSYTDTSSRMFTLSGTFEVIRCAP